MTILCYDTNFTETSSRECMERYTRLVVINPRFEKHTDWQKRVSLVPHGNYQALCRKHFKRLRERGTKFAQWTGTLLGDTRRGHFCCHPRCSFSATEFFWRRDSLANPSLSFEEKCVVTGRKLPILTKVHYEWCRFHADEAAYGTFFMMHDRYKQISIDEYNKIFVESILNE